MTDTPINIHPVNHPIYQQYLAKTRHLEMLVIKNQKLSHEKAEIPIKAAKEVIKNRTVTREKNTAEIDHLKAEIKNIETNHDNSVELINKLSHEMPFLKLEHSEKQSAFEILENSKMGPNGPHRSPGVKTL